MLDALDTIATAWTEIMAGRLWDEPEQAAQRQMRILKMGLQTKRVSVDLGRDYPFLLMYVRGGEDGAGKSSFVVDLLAGIHIKPDRDGDGDVDGEDDIVTPATEAMGFLVASFRRLQGYNYSPYSLEKIKWQIGDADGGHPGPDNYIVAAVLEFQQEFIF